MDTILLNMSKIFLILFLIFKPDNNLKIQVKHLNKYLDFFFFEIAIFVNPYLISK